MSKTESLVVYNPRAGKKEGFRKADSIKNIAGSHVCSLDGLEAGEVKVIPDKVFIVGGDGTIRGTVSWLSRHECYPTLCLVGGGTLNLLKGLVGKETHGVSLNEINNPEVINQRAISYKTGEVVLDSRRIASFVVNAGFGEFEKQWSYEREKLRAKGQNTVFAHYVAGIEALKDLALNGKISQGIALQVFSLKELVGPFRVFSEKDLRRETFLIGLAEIKGESPSITLAKLTLALSLWKLGFFVPQSILSIEYAEIFKKGGKTHLLDVNVDGDLRTIDGEGELLIQKSQIPFMMTVIT